MHCTETVTQQANQMYHFRNVVAYRLFGIVTMMCCYGAILVVALHGAATVAVFVDANGDDDDDEGGGGGGGVFVLLHTYTHTHTQGESET